MTIKKTFLAIILTTVLALCISGYSQASSIDSVQKVTLANGLTLVLNEQPSRDIISLCLFVDGGARIESPDVSGISHFIEHLVFRGPSNLSKELELRQNFRIWGEFEGYTSDDLTCYGFTTRSAEFDDALDAFVDGLMNLSIPESVIDKERTVVTSEINQRGDLPVIKLYSLFDRTAFKVHSYANNIIGPEELIRSLDSDVIRDYYHEHYTPDHFIIGITGNFDGEKMVSRIEGAFDAYQSSGKDFERGITEPPQTEPRYASETTDVSSMNMLTGWRIPPAMSADIPGIEVLAEILGGSEDSRLFKALKIDNALVDEIYCFADSHHDANYIYVYVIADPVNQDEITAVIHNEIESLKQNPPSDAELLSVQTRIRNDYSFNLQTFWDISSYLARWELYGNLEQGQNFVSLVEKIAPQDISDLTSKYLIEQNMTQIALLPENTASLVEESKQAQFETKIAKLNPGDTSEFDLKNSAKAIFRYDTASDIVGISILAGLGQVMEDGTNRGIGEFTSRMLMKGCGNLDSEEFRKRMEEIGCQISSSASRDYINVSMEVRIDQFENALQLLGDVLYKPRFDDNEIELVRDEIVAQLERKIEDPFGYVNDGFYKEIFGDTPYAFPVDGAIETVSKITKDDLAKFHKLAFSPKFQVIGVAGDIDYARLMMLLDRHLGKFTGSEDVGVADFDYPIFSIPKPESDETILEMPRSQISFNMGIMGVGADDPDYPALKTAVRVLGLRVFDKYVYELGWAYRMWFYMSTTRAPSPIMFEMGVAPEQFDEARLGLTEALSDMTVNLVSEDELEKNKKYTLQSFYLGMQKNADTAFTLAFYEKSGIGWEYVVELDRIVNGITSEDLLRVAKKYFDPDRMILYATTPE